MVLCGALGPDLSPGAPRHFAWQAWHLVTSTFVSCGRRGTQLTSTVVLRGRRGTHGTVWRAWPGFVARGAAAFCVAGVALGDIHLRFMRQAWHTTHIHRRSLSTHTLSTHSLSTHTLSTHTHTHTAWHLVTSTFVSRGVARLVVTFTLVSRGRRGTQLTSTVVLRGRRGTHGTVWRAWPGFVARGAAAFCVAGVALGDIHLRFMRQAWHTTHIHRRFAWQAWHSWYCVARLARICRPGRRGILRGRRGTW